ncbi:hypothetical protein D3C84_1028910 [compost metagenome]
MRAFEVTDLLQHVVMTLAKEFGNFQGGSNRLALMQADDIGRAEVGDAVHRCVLQTTLGYVTVEVPISNW